MTALSAQRILLASRPEGKAKAENFRLEKVAIPEPQDGQLLLETHYLSLDPYRRTFAERLRRGGCS